MERTRFSLLLLEPGEIYFEDFSAYLFSSSDTEENFETSRQLGRLKLCSKSLVFDPQNFNQPILKIPLQHCDKIDLGKRSWIFGEDNVLRVECISHAEMLEGNVIAAYNFKQGKTVFLFLLNYAKVDDCLSQILQLHRASTLLPPEQNSMIAAIVFSKQSRISFDTKWLEDIYEKVILETQGNKISPLVVNPGRIVLTCSRLYFQPYNNVESYPVLKIDLKNITRIICRRFLLKQVGIEISYRPRTGNDESDHFYFVLKSKEERDRFYASLLEQPSLSLNTQEQEVMTLKWQNRAISTYEYLLYLNSLADRSFNDLTQYPVFPWVLSNYLSKTLDLDDSKSYRDLSKPIGALNEERLQKLKKRTEEMPEPKFLYGSHYSAPGFVIFYLVRKFPHYMLCLQNGRFDYPDRMFNSISDVWRNVLNNMSDFKELIPEFYDVSQGGDFLMNTYGINFGHRCDGSKVHDVHLPPWAESASDFVSKLREALESEYVSQNIHHWIDLIFGYKQRGEEARKAHNVFYYLCYEGAVDIDLVKDHSEKHALEVQIMEFGQIPKQIFKVPHPPRLPLLNSSKGLNTVHLSGFNTNSENCWKDISNLDKAKVLGQHKDAVTSVVISNSNKFVLSSSKDSTIKMFSIENEKQIRSFHLTNIGISCCILLPDDNIIVAGTFDDYIYVYDINFGKVMDSIMAHEDAVTSICWGNRSRCLVSSSWDCTVKVWCNIYQGDNWHRLKVTSVLRFDLDSRVTCSVINSENNLVGCGTEEGEVIIINITNNSTVLKSTAHTDCVSAVSFSPDSGKLVSCSWDGGFKVFDLLTGMEVYSKTLQAQLSCLAWDGFSLILGSNSGTLFLWDLMEVKLLEEIKCNGKNIYCISVSKCGKLAVAGEDKMVVLRS